MALIPARAGSKGLKNKNLLPFGKNSLVERTFHLVGEILEKEKVVLSSDYKFEAFSKFLKKSQYRQRPKFLSEDNSSIIDVCLDSYNFLSSKNKDEITDLLLMQPTSPFRTSKDLKSAISFYKDNNLKSLASVSPVIQHPYEIINGTGNKWNSIIEWEGHKNRQKLKNNYYFINGCFYIININYLKENKRIVNSNTYMYQINGKYSIDIDDYEDFQFANKILS